jgi:L-gulono-1,4-lactone dehydrogenase
VTNGSLAITGAGGGIGRALVAAARDRGETVRGLFRSDDDRAAAARTSGVEVVIGDLGDEAALARLLGGGDVRVVFHTAAAVTRDLKQADAVNVEGTRRVAEAAVAAGVRRFVHFSSVAVYLGHAAEHARFPESLEPVENDRMDAYARTKWRAELALREVAAASNLETVVLRPTCVYGPHVDSWTLTPLMLIAKGLPLQLTRGPGCIDVIFVDDLARAALDVAEHEAAAGRAFNVGGGLVRTDEFLGRLGAMIGRRPRKISGFGAKLAIGVASAVGRVVALPPEAEPNRLRLLRMCTTAAPGSDPFPTDAIRPLIGDPSPTSLEDGMLATQLWLATAGHLDAVTWDPLRAATLTYAFTPRARLRAAGEAGVQRVVATAFRERRQLRTLGALHSIAPLPVTHDLALVLDEPCDVERIDGDLVTVAGGMRLEALNEALAARGLALPIVGGIARQTVGGALATGTHGSSLGQGSLLEAVERLRVVTAESEEAPVREYRRGDADFPGIGLSLGCCGVTTEVTLRAVPAFGLRSTVTRTTFDEFVRDWERRIAAHEFVEFYWHPLIDVVEVIACDRTDPAAGVPASRVLRPVPPLRVNRLARPLVRRVFRLMHEGRRRWLHRRTVERRVGRWYPEREGRSDFVLAYHEVVENGIPIEDVEVAVPWAEAMPAVEALREHFRRVDRYPVLGVRIRVQRAEPFWLSAAYERDVCWIEVYHPPPAERFLGEMDAVFEPFGYRPHWGKTAVGDPTVIAARYPEWDRFLELRARCDPRGVFLNAHLRERLSSGELG